MYPVFVDAAVAARKGAFMCYSSKVRMIEAIRAYPTLGAEGFGQSPEAHAQFLNNITDNDVQLFEKCRDWLRYRVATKIINRKYSPSLMHWDAAKISDPNGVFYAALIDSGFRFRIRGRKAYVAIRKKGIRRLAYWYPGGRPVYRD
jgi:hypothetical protein